jgi:hypothetical protein
MAGLHVCVSRDAERAAVGCTRNSWSSPAVQGMRAPSRSTKRVPERNELVNGEQAGLGKLQEEPQWVVSMRFTSLDGIASGST